MTSGSISSRFSRFHFIFFHFFLASSDIAIFFLGREDKYYEPEYWKFGEDGNKYFRHATGQLYAISKDLAAYISINSWVPYPKASVFPHLLPSSQSNIAILKYFGRPILHRYANEDVSLGSWLLGLEVELVDERSMCCGTPPGTQIHHSHSHRVDIFQQSICHFLYIRKHNIFKNKLKNKKWIYINIPHF